MQWPVTSKLNTQVTLHHLNSEVMKNILFLNKKHFFFVIERGKKGFTEFEFNLGNVIMMLCPNSSRYRIWKSMVKKNLMKRNWSEGKLTQLIGVNAAPVNLSCHMRKWMFLEDRWVCAEAADTIVLEAASEADRCFEGHDTSIRFGVRTDKGSLLLNLIKQNKNRNRKRWLEREFAMLL